jgi:hypothetical protein
MRLPHAIRILQECRCEVFFARAIIRLRLTFCTRVLQRLK